MPDDVHRPIGFVGVGQMGGAMAERLLDAGHRVVVFDPQHDRVAALADRGADAAGSVVDVANACETVFTCLPSVDICEAVAKQLGDGTSITMHVESSTIGRAGIARVAAAHPRIATIDAPVSGGPKGARAGTLVAIVSGEADTIAAARPLLDAIVARVFVVGPRLGDAQVAKIINNALSISAMVVSCEAIVLGVKAGLDARQLVDLINAGTGRNSATQDKFPKAILPRTFDYGGSLGIGVKDLQLYLDESAAEGLSAWSIATAADVWRRAVDELGDDVDVSALVRYMERRAGIEVDGRGSTA